MTSGIDTTALSLLQHKRIYFGHQSVGANIVEGIRDLCRKQGIPALRIVESSQAEDFADPAFGHSAIGRNHDPRSKIDAFAGILGAGLGNRVDLAFFKFCYVDVTDGSDVAGLFGYYRSVMEQLGAAYPRTRFVHLTVPVTVMPGLARRVLGTLRGRRNRAAYDNLARAEYNRLLTRTYTGHEPLFDLAGIESTTPTGRVLRHTLKGQELRSLVPAYSDDGRHLSGSGRRVVASALLDVLAAIATPKEHHAGQQGNVRA